MRKNQKFTAIVKGALAAALSLSMIVTSLAVMPNEAAAEDAVPVKVLNFDKGLREFRGFNYDLETNEFAEGEGDKNFTIIKSPNVMVQKIGDQVEENSDKVDANNFVYTGNAESTVYHTTPTSNQPATMYDDVKGTVYVLFDTVELKELVKNVSASIMTPAAEEGAEPTLDEAATNALDASKPIGTVVREAMKVKCAMQISNPLAGSTSDAVSITYWAYIPEGTTKDAVLMVFDDAIISEGSDEESDEVEAAAAEEMAPVELFVDADSTVAPAGTWAHVAMVVTADGAKFYVNGAETTESYVLGDATVAAFTTPKALVMGGSESGQLDTVYDTRLDDVSFYETALTAEQIQAAYNADVAKMNATVDVTAPDKVFKLEDLSEVTDIGDESITVVDETINGTSVKAIEVSEVARATYKSGFYLTENPFAGEQLDGITVGYWVKQGPSAADERRAEEGQLPVPGDYTSLMFLDEEKVVYDPKNATENSEKARSILKVDNNLSAMFEEGSFNEVANHLKNSFVFSNIPVATEEETAAGINPADAIKQAAMEWQYLTITVTNGGIQMYLNGEELVNHTQFVHGMRYSDGYYGSLADRVDPIKLYGVFGGTNNQCATQLMSFIGYEDTKMYFGWSTADAKTTTRAGESYYYNISCYKAAMTAEEVEALYAQELANLNPTSTETPGPSVIYGDVDANGSVEASDALLVLKAVVKLVTLDETQTVAADVDGKVGVEAADALEILKNVVKLIDKFPVEK